MIPDHLRENREAHSPALSELVKNIENKHPYIQEGCLFFYIYKKR